MFIAYDIDSDDPILYVMLFFTASLAMAFSNVVIDAIFVIQARRDEELGS